MVVAQTDKLRTVHTHPKEWRETVENLRILGTTCLEIAEQMEKKLSEAQHEDHEAKQPQKR